MKAEFIWIENGKFQYASYDDVMDAPFSFEGYSEDRSEKRAKGILCPRVELDNQPIFNGFLAPMWNNGGLRYESMEVYNQLSI